MFISCRHSIHDDYKIAKDKIEAEEWENAIPLLTQIIDKDSSLHEAFQSRGQCYYNTNDYKLAINDFNAAYELNKNYKLQYNLGVLSIKNENYSNAINYFEEYENFDSTNPDIWVQKALCYNTLKDFQSALFYYEKAVDSFPDSIALIKNMGVCHFQLSNYNSAINLLNSYVDTVINDKSSFEMMAYSYYQLGMYEKANKYYNHLIDLGIELDEVTQRIFSKNLLLLGLKQKNNQNFMAALQTFSQVITLEPLEKKAFYYRGLVYLQFERKTEACEDFNQAFLNGSKEANSMMKLHCKEFFD